MLEVAVTLVFIFGLTMYMGNKDVTEKDDADMIICVGICLHSSADHAEKSEE